MALLHWRRFAFFDEDMVKDSELNRLVDEHDNKEIITVKLTCSSSGRGYLLLGDENGYIHIINKHLKTNSFRANEKYTSHVKQVPKLPIFITGGSDQDGTNPLIKLWDPEKMDKFNQPTCMKVIRANSGFTDPVQVTCIECSANLSLMAVGYEDGTLVLFQDVIKRRRSKKSGLLKVGDSSITGIRILGETSLTGFITTEHKIFHARFQEVSMVKNLLDNLGCRPKCFCQAHEGLFAVGRDDAVYFYDTDGRGPCLAFEGEKHLLYRYKTYLVLISRASKSSYFYIYDIKNKYIAHSSLIPEVQEVVSDWGHLFLICVNGKILRLKEKDTQTKLKTLYKKNQFGLVIDIARSLHYGEEALVDIYKHYGDHLFRERDFDGSIPYYIKTIGRLEPTFVIKKFLTVRRYRNLAVYLEALHSRSQAGPEHLKILRNCYSKLGEDDNSEHLVSVCEASDSNLELRDCSELVPALIEYSSSGDERFKDVLRDIEQQKSILPMLIISILLNSSSLTLSSVRSYLTRFLAKSNERHVENLNSIDYYENDTELLRQKIDEFKNNQTIFHPSKCSACNGNLDLPSVHFLCNHCYHLKCFYNHSADDDECPICLASNRKLLDEISSHETGKLLPENMDKLTVKPDEEIYRSVAMLFGYGLIN